MSGVSFVKARKGPGRSIIYTTGDGTECKYSGGDPAWRSNNPGNLVPGNVSKRNGAIGVAGGFAIFPDYEAGHRALLDSLKTSHGNKSLQDMIAVFAPPSENKTTRYLRFLRAKTGVRDNRKIADFSSAEFEKLWRAIEQMEGRRPGRIKQGKSATLKKARKQISRVRKNKKGTIVSYFVDGIGWISKEQGIALAERGELDAVVATSRAGNLFLRTRPGIEIENLEDMG